MALPSARKINLLVVLALFASVGLAFAAESLNPPLTNWSMPKTWSPHSASRGVTTQADISRAFVGIAITPCRQFDVRPGTLLDNTNLTITLTGAPCGIPAGVPAVSVNITVFSITGAGGNGVFQVGTASNPTFAWINYPPTEAQRGNAGIVPLNGSGQIVVKVNQGGGSIQLTVDVNGYFVDSSAILNPGQGLNLEGNISGAVSSGTNDTTASGIFVSGVGGAITGAGNGGSGVVGLQFGAGNTGAGVLGLQFSSTGLNYGVAGLNASAAGGSAGVYGAAVATTGFTHGVFGQSSSQVFNNSAVLGVMGSAAVASTSWSAAGGRFESFDNNGVVALTNNSGACAVVGARYNTSGTTIGSSGLLGCTSGGVLYTNGLSGTGTKSFLEPHPKDASKMIRYVSLEGPEAGTYFRGTARTINGLATIQVPETFRFVTDDDGLTVQLTPVGSAATMYIVSEDLNTIVVHSSRDVTFHYLVQGVRRAYKDFEAVVENDFFKPRGPDERMDGSLSPVEKQRLIQTGIYNEDGTVNMETAERLGWAKEWADREAANQAASARAAAQQKALPAGFGSSWSMGFGNLWPMR